MRHVFYIATLLFFGSAVICCSDRKYDKIKMQKNDFSLGAFNEINSKKIKLNNLKNVNALLMASIIEKIKEKSNISKKYNKIKYLSYEAVDNLVVSSIVFLDDYEPDLPVYKIFLILQDTSGVFVDHLLVGETAGDNGEVDSESDFVYGESILAGKIEGRVVSLIYSRAFNRIKSDGSLLGEQMHVLNSENYVIDKERGFVKSSCNIKVANKEPAIIEHISGDR